MKLLKMPNRKILDRSNKRTKILGKLMAFEVNLQSKAARITFSAIGFVFFLLLLKSVVSGFVVDTFADRRLPVTREMLEQATDYFPASGQLLARLAEMEETDDADDINSSEEHINEAIWLSPRNFRNQMLLGDIKDTRGDLRSAEEAFAKALTLAPNYSEVHWRYANVLLREGKMSEAVDQFRAASTLNQKFVTTSLELVWNASGKDAKTAAEVAGNNPAAQMKFARLLAADGDLQKAIEVFSGIDSQAALKSSESPPFLDSLLKRGYPKAAFDLWRGIVDPNISNSVKDFPQIWNAGFENEISKTVNSSSSSPLLQQFNWRLANSDYAKPSIDSKNARSGQNSLLIDFTGRDTTKLGSEVKQILVLVPGAKYQISFYARAENLQTPEGPKVAVSTLNGELIASSNPLNADDRDWKKFTFDFTAQKAAEADGVVVVLSVIRQPRYVYDEPTRGRARFDDFSISGN